MEHARPSTSHVPPMHSYNLSGAGPMPMTSGFHSANNSLSSRASSSDLHAVHQLPQPITPCFDSDGSSVRSAKLQLSPRWKGLRNIFTRRSSSDATETLSHYSTPSASPTQSLHHPRRPSLPKFTAFHTAPASRKHSFVEAGGIKPTAGTPDSPKEELQCQRCYYFAARNCNGWVLGGAHGAPCESCLQLGFTGMP